MPGSWNSGNSSFNNSRNQRSERGRPSNRDRNYGHETENEKRKRSFVVFGLPQLPDGTAEQKHNEDHTAAIDIIRYLGVHDVIPKNYVKRARNSPVLIITLESVESRDLILKRAHFLYENEPTRHLRIEKAHTAEDMVRRFGHLPNDEELDRRNYSRNRNDSSNDYSYSDNPPEYPPRQDRYNPNANSRLNEYERGRNNDIGNNPNGNARGRSNGYTRHVEDRPRGNRENNYPRGGYSRNNVDHNSRDSNSGHRFEYLHERYSGGDNAEFEEEEAEYPWNELGHDHSDDGNLRRNNFNNNNNSYRGNPRGRRYQL